MRKHGKTMERSVAIFLFGFIAFSPPFLGIFGAEALVLGLPLLYLYLFAAWGLIIVLIAWIADTGTGPEAGRNPEPRTGPH